MRRRQSEVAFLTRVILIWLRYSHHMAAILSSFLRRNQACGLGPQAAPPGWLFKAGTRKSCLP